MDEVLVQFATGMHVTNELGAFHLVFSRFTQPVFLTPADYEPYAKQGFVPADVVARVIVTPPVLEELIRVLQEQLERSRDASQRWSEQMDQGAGQDNEGSSGQFDLSCC